MRIVAALTLLVCAACGARGRRFVGHTGGAAGMSGVLEFEPNGGYVIVVLSNFDSAATQVATFILDRLPGTPAGGGI